MVKIFFLVALLQISFQCSAGEYYSIVYSICRNCKSECATCSGGIIKSEILAFTCSTCKSGYYLSAQQCPSCNGGCATCTSSSSSSCQSCESGYYLSGSSCPVCVSPCATCTSSTACSSCVDGYYISGSSCPACTSPCSKCVTSSTNCTDCVSGYMLSGSTCLPCTKPCSQCSGSQTSCTACVDSGDQSTPSCDCTSPSKYMDTDYTCANCVSPCQNCSSSTSCDSCLGTYYLSGHTCLPCTKPCQNCSGSATNCTSCVDSSNQSTPSCDCISTAKNMNTSTYYCTSCASPCLNCSSATSCDSCVATYYLSGNTCLPCTKPCVNCTGSATNCTSCVDSSNQTVPTCDCTSPAKYLDTSTYYCVNCISPCLNCSTASLCDSCVANYVISGNTCLACTKPCVQCTGNQTTCTTCVDSGNQSTPTCDCTSPSKYLDTSNYNCVNCVSPCLNCSTASLCDSCVATYYLSGNTCIACTKPCADCTGTGTNCTSCIDSTNQSAPSCSCPSGYLLNTGTYYCTQCTYPCTTCQNSVTQCYSCASTYTYDSTAHTCTCSSGQYEQTGTPNTCQSCTSPCLTCSTTNTHCNSCVAGLNRILSGNLCVCNNGYFDNGGTCTSCTLPCINCTSLSVCTSCNDSANQSGSSCTCQATYYMNASYLCIPCKLPCKYCIENETNCISCINSDQILSFNTCLCNEGYYMDKSFVCQLMGQNCQLPCITCTYPSYCTSCNSGYYLESEGSCLECQNSCKLCNDANICEYCKDGYFLQGYICIQCDKNCQTCIDSNDNCQSCKPNEQLIENRCHCDSNTIKLSTDTCIQCEYPCLTCQNQDFCLQCASLDRLFLSNDNQCVCEEGSIWQNSNCQVVCPKFCFQCLDGVCLGCQENYSLNNNQCSQIKTCGNGELDSQELCDDGNDTPNDGCYKCEVEENWQCNTERPSQCTYFEPPYLLVSYLNQTAPMQYIDLKFSSEVWTDSKKNLSDNLIITITNITQDNYKYTIYAIKEISINLSYGHYQIAAEIQQQLQQKPMINIYLDQNIFNEYGIPLEIKTAQIQLNIPKYLNPEQKKIAETVQNTNENIIYGLGAISFLSLFMGEAAVFQEILKLLQYQSYLKFINLDYPENLQTFFKSTNIVSVSAIVKYTNLNYYLTKYSLKQGPLKTDGKFAFYSYDADLITNLSCQFIQFSVLVIVGLSTRFLQGKFYNQINNNLFIKWMNDLYNDYSAKNFIFGSLKLLDSIIKSIFVVAKQFSKQGLRALFIINSQDLIFKAMIYLHYMQFDSIRNIIQAALAFTIVSSYITLMFYALWKNNFIFKVETKEKLQIQYDVIILARQTLFITLIVFCQPNQVIQTVLITFINIVCFILLKRKKQFGNFFQFISQVNEMLIIFFMIFSFIFFNDLASYFTEEFKIKIGWVQIGILCMSLVLEASKFVITKCQGLIKYIKKKINEQKKKQEIDPIKLFWALPM